VAAANKLKRGATQGKRIDAIDYDPSFHWMLRVGIERELASLPWRDPQPGARRYASKTVVATGARLELVALPGAVVSTDDLLPPPADS